MKLNKKTGKFIEEKWAPLKGFEDKYIISNTGEVAQLKRNWWGEMEKVFVNQHKDKDGYLRVTLVYNGKYIGKGVHRLVAETFLSNLENKPEVEHKNCVRDCNCVLNLKWVTRVENQNNELTKQHYREAQQDKQGKKVMCITTGKTFNSIKEAGRYYNVCSGSITRCCNGKLKSAGKLNGTKLQWKYL